MKLNLRPVIASAAVLVITGGVLAATVGTAAAATTPPWEPDGNSLGSLTFYNAAGNVVTGGSNLNHLFDYAQASTTDPSTTPGTLATLTFANPAPSTPTGSFSTGQASQSQPFPNAGAPAPLTTSNHPVATVSQNPADDEADLGNFALTHTVNTASGFANVYQIRVSTSKAGGGGTGTSKYWEDDVMVQGGSWREIFPTTGVFGTSTVLTATPNPAAQGTSVSLTATVDLGTAGTMQFLDGATPIGSSAVNATTGVATLSTSSLGSGPHTLSAVFVPTDTTNYAGDTSNTVTENIVPGTSTALAVSGAFATAGGGATLTATVTSGGTGTNAGSVEFLDGASPANGTVTASTVSTGTAGGVFTLTIPSASGGAFTQGNHSITAVFTPTNPAQLAGSSSSPPFTFFTAGGACAQPGAACEDLQSITATIPVGTLVISTPYTAQSPLQLGTLTPNATATQYSANAPFYCIVVTDARSGQPLGWTASAESSDLTDGTGHPAGTIDSQNVGLTGLTFPLAASTDANAPACAKTTPTQSYVGNVALTSNPAASPAVAPGAALGAAGDQGLGGPTAGSGGLAHTFAVGSGGGGSVTMQGTLTLNAPTSTEAGTFNGTVDFTVG